MRKTALWRIGVLLIFLTVIVQGNSVLAQITEAQARILLEQRGIPEDTLRARLIAKGFDPDNIQAGQLERFQNVILETIAEIESDKRKVAGQPKSPEPVQVVDQLTQAPVEPPKEVREPQAEPIAPKSFPIYGQEIFRNNSIAVYKKTEDGIAPDSYVLDAGDKIGVIGIGRSQFQETLEIGPEGFVQPSGNLPRILLRGIKWVDAKEILFQRFRSYYEIGRGEFQASLVKPRNMTINVFGESKTTGAITLPGINTAINVISAAGGPTDIGSVRRIKIIRGSKSIPLDIYAFMNDPSVADNFYLQNNDYIHIPVAQKVVTIRGAVTRPMRYELLEDENLVQLIRYAGGATPKAYLGGVQVTRYLQDKKVITDVNLRDLMGQGGDYILLNGDIIDIRDVSEAAENYVQVSGAVNFPGNYERKPGMRISDLMAMAVPRPEARMDFAYLLRYQADGTFKFQRINLQEAVSHIASADNMELNDKDVLQVMNLKTYADASYFTLEGAVKSPGRYSFDPNGRMRLEDALLLAGGPVMDASDNGYLIRSDPKEPKQFEYIDINIREALDNPASAANLEIRSGDLIRLFDKASRRDDLFVSVFGAVRTPGRYTYASDMSLGDVINLAGGFTFEADNKRIDIARIDIDDQNNLKITQTTTALAQRDYQMDDQSMMLKPFDHIYVRTIPEFELQQTVRIDGEVRYPGTYPLLRDKERISDVLERAGGITGKAFPEGAKLYRQGDSTGLVVINLADILRNKNTPSNIILVKGDVIEIPKSRDLVTIEGFVNLDQLYSSTFLLNEKAISVAFRGEKSAKYYIDQFAAGISEKGSPAQVKVQYADGHVERTKRFLFFNAYPRVEKGAQVIVGAKPVKPQVPREEKKTDWANVLRDTMAQATAVLTLLILVDQLSK